MNPILGCIGDDFTGSTDLANTLVRQGMRVIQLCGVPPAGFAVPEADALVVSLKCRSIDPADAVAQCRSALAYLRGAGCRQFFWKYCSTFDSTAKGNIGPVAKALLDDLGGETAIVCPAFPENKRSIYMGNLFVGEVPLDESPMRDHPVTPMRDANLQRLLAPQVGESVGLVPWPVVRRGAQAVREALAALGAAGTRFAVADALEDADLFTLAEACPDMLLITGGSGISMGLPENYRKAGLLERRVTATCSLDVAGPTAMLSGSCSEATRHQIKKAEEGGIALRRLDALQLAAGPAHLRDVLEWAKSRMPGPMLVHAGATPEEVAHVQAKLGKEESGRMVEEALSFLAVALRDAGARRFIVAGGESSGAVVSALNVTGLRIGEQIAPGVPWTVTIDEPVLALALKSGNFGGPDFFVKAQSMLP